jgi:hypothetical protein
MGITKLNNVFSALAVFAITTLLSVQAEYYWLAVGIPAGANGNVNSGLGNYLVLTNDDPSVSFNAVKLYDVRRRANNGTELYKNNGQNSTPPYEGCLKGGAHYDLRLPIRDEAGTEFTFVGFANEAFRGNDFLGSIHLPDTLEYINKQAFWQARYLKEFVWPEDMTRLNTIGSRILDTCSSLVGPIEWPSKFPNVAQACWNCPALVGFGGICITNLGDNAFQNCSSLRTVEFGGAEPVTFGNCTFQNTGSLKTVLFHDNPPTLNKYILGFDPSTGGGVGNTAFDWWSSNGTTVYVPLNAAKDGPTGKWLAFKTAYESAKEGNAVVFPTRDEETGEWGVGSIILKQYNKTVKLRFWDPDAQTTSALLAY